MLGSALHARLEAKYSGREVPLWGGEVDQSVPEDVAKAENTVADMLANYEEWLAETGEDQRWEPVEAEQQHSREHGGRVYTGKLDAVWRDRETARDWVVDHKTTGANLQQQAGKIAKGTQPTHYLWLLGDRVVGLLLNMVKRASSTQDPAYRHEVYRTSAQLDTYGDHLLEWGNAMESAQAREDVPPPAPQDACGWCEFRVLCAAQDAGEDVEYLKSAEFVQTDPMARYREDT
jgi:PD-(D/E)XK nuclease superfamily